jgi:hypothetical protein
VSDIINDPAGVTETGVAALVALKEEGTPFLLDLLDHAAVERNHTLYLTSIKPEYVHPNDLLKLISALDVKYSPAARLLALMYLAKKQESGAFFNQINASVQDLRDSPRYGPEATKSLNAIREAK